MEIMVVVMVVWCAAYIVATVGTIAGVAVGYFIGSQR